MAIFVFTEGQVTLNSQDISTYVQSVTLSYAKDSIETTAMGATGHVFTGGLQNLSVSLEVQNDEAANKTMPTLWSATGSGSNTLVIKNTSTGATFTCSNMFLESSTPVNGAVGELSIQSVTFTGGSVVKS